MTENWKIWNLLLVIHLPKARLTHWHGAFDCMKLGNVLLTSHRMHEHID